MSTKIYVNPATHAEIHPCVGKKGCNETAHCLEYCRILCAYLRACGFEVKMGEYSYKSTQGMLDAIKESNAWGANLHMAVHTNGCASHEGTGSRPMYYSVGYGKPIVDKILEWRAKIYPRKMKSGQNQQLAELRDTKATAVYEELVFHDNKEDAVWFHENMQRMAEYTARALCEYYGVAFVDPFSPPPEPEKSPLYRVQVGAFRHKGNAESMLKKLKEAGFDGYIKEGD